MSAEHTIHFSYEECVAFAEASGDINKIHTDREYANRLPGKSNICFGILLVLKTLEVLQERPFSFSVDFINQVETDSDVRVMLLKDCIKGIKADNNLAFLIKILNKNPSYAKHSSEYTGNRVVPVTLSATLVKDSDFSDLVDVDFIVPLQSYKGLFSKFQYLAKNWGEDFIRRMADCSFIVGMCLPGEDSLFVGLDYQFFQPCNMFLPENTSLATLKKWRPGLGLMEVSCRSNFANYHIRAMKRDRRIEQRSVRSINSEIVTFSKESFSVLVVGGSNGIGAAASRLFALMGCKVTLTYNLDSLSAREVKEDIDSLNLKYTVHIRQLDVSCKALDLTERYDIVFYCASPQIRSIDDTGTLDRVLVRNQYLSIYVDGFLNLVRQCNTSERRTLFIYPSTVFIDKCPHGFQDYADIKMVGEELCQRLNRDPLLNVEIRVVRLPKLRTSQTISSLEKDLPFPDEVLSSILCGLLSEYQTRLIR